MPRSAKPRTWSEPGCGKAGEDFEQAVVDGHSVALEVAERQTEPGHSRESGGSGHPFLDVHAPRGDDAVTDLQAARGQRACHTDAQYGVKRTVADDLLRCRGGGVRTTDPGDDRPWITPDISVELTADEYFEGIDPVLDRVLDQVRSENGF